MFLVDMWARANFLGGQKYAATWTGDNESSWDHLRVSIPMSINLGLSGQPFNGPDIGGFSANPTPELYAHWISLGAFYPFSRVHSELGTIDHEPWAFGKEIEDVARTALNRRYRLMPYLYTLFHEASINGMPVMRPAFFADLPNPYIRGEKEAFLLGADLFVIPKWAEEVVTPGWEPEDPQVGEEAIFEEGQEEETGEEEEEEKIKTKWRSISLVGEDSENDTYQPNILIRPGAIVPLGEIIQSTAEYNIDKLTLYISIDDNDNKASGTLYHDQGDGYAYKKGDYALISFQAEKKNSKITITKSTIEGNLPIDFKEVNIKLILDDKVISGSYTFTNNKINIIL